MSLSAVLFCPTEPDTAKNMDNQDDCEWTITLQPHSEGVDTSVAPPHVESLNLVPGQQPEDGSLFPDSATQADSSLLPPSAPQVTTHIYTQTDKVRLSKVVFTFDF